MTTDTSKIGQWGEGVAVKYLENTGYTILTRNYHTSRGEVDIIALSPDTRLNCLVFVEVKTRTSHKHGYPEEAVGRSKWERLQAAIQRYLESHPDESSDWCVDVIAIVGHPDQGDPEIQHFENVVMIDDRY